MFTFKKEARQKGLAGVANPFPATAIKYKGIEVGKIFPPSRYNGDKWKVGLQIEEKASENCPWGWKMFSESFEKEDDARTWINKKNLSRYTLYIKKD